MSDMRISEMEITIRLYNCLNRAGLETANDIAAISAADLFRLPNLGRLSMRELVDEFTARGLPKHPTWADYGTKPRSPRLSFNSAEAERAAIVTMIRANGDIAKSAGNAGWFACCKLLADAIEQSAHLTPQEKKL